jgi:hypothetical protein
MTPTKPDPHAAGIRASHRHGEHDVHDNEEVAHEHSDINVRAVLMFCMGLVVVVAVVQVAMWGLFEVLERQAAQNDPIVSPLAIPEGQVPPEPRLLENEPAYLRQIKAGEAQILGDYGWVDQKTGAARIPIDDAKKKLLEQGLPVRADGPAGDLLGTSLPARGEASSGRIITARPEQTIAPKPAEGTQAPAEHKPVAPQKSGGH